MAVREYPFVQTAGDAIDETAGTPRVKLLRNGQLDRAGRIVRTPAWSDAWAVDEDGTALPETIHAVTGGKLGRGVMLTSTETTYPTLPLRCATLGGEGGWHRNTSELDALVPVEAPRSIDALAKPGYSLFDGMLLPTDRTDTWVLVADTNLSSDWYVDLRLLSTVDGVQVVTELSGVGPYTERAYAKVCGSYLLWKSTVGAAMYIASYSVTGGWTTHKTIDITGATGRFDAQFDPATNSIAIVRSDGSTMMVTIANWGDAGWTSRAAAFTLPVIGTYSIAVVSGTVWLACRCEFATDRYYIMSWVYPTWSTTQVATEADSAAIVGGIPMLSPGSVVNGVSRVWMCAQSISNAYSATYGSLHLVSYGSDLTVGRGVDLWLTDCQAVSEVLDEGNDGAWLVVMARRTYLSQAWLLWLDKTSSQQYQHTGTALKAASRLWQGRVNYQYQQRVGSLVHAELGCGAGEPREGLMWTGRVVLDTADLAGLRQTAIAVASCSGLAESSVTWGWGVSSRDQWPPDLLQSAAVGGGLQFAAGIPLAVGHRPEAVGCLEQPQQPSLANAAIGATHNVDEVYQYRVLCRFVDSQGNLHMSGVSEATSITSDGHNIDVTLRGILHYPGAQSIRYEVYRTVGNGTVFYRLTTVEWFDATDSMVVYADITPDSQITSYKMLYSQGSTDPVTGLPSALGGRLETWGPPSCRFLWAGSTRMIAGGLERDTQVRLSNLYYPGEGIGWPDHGGFKAEVPERVTAVAALDDVFLVWTRNGLYYIGGMGPDVQGVGEFDPPRRIAGAPGCRSWRSLCETEQGIYYQAPNLQVYLLQRGTLQAVHVSAEWDEYIAGSHSTEPGTYGELTAAIAGAAYLPTEGLIYFARRALTEEAAEAGLGGTVLHSPSTGTWSVETETGELARAAGTYSYDGTEHPVVLTYLLGAYPDDPEPLDGDAVLSPVSQYTGAARYTSYHSGYPHTLTALVTHVVPWESGGHGVLRRIGVLASKDRTRSETGDVWTGLTIEVRYDGEQTTAAGNSYEIEPAGTQDDTGRWLYQLAPSRIRCSEAALVLSDESAGAETWWHRLTIDADPAQGSRLRKRAGNERV